MHPNDPDVLKSNTVKVLTPDGAMFFTIVENNSKPVGVDIVMGKAGSSIQAWAQALSHIITLALRSGVNISVIAEEVSGITSDKIAMNGDKTVRSVPDAIAQSILIYLATKTPSMDRRRHRRGPSVFGEEVG